MSSSENSPKAKWYYGVVPVVVALLLAGPFAFPLLWKSPRFSFAWKAFLTVGVTAATVWMLWATWKIVAIVMNQIRSLGLV